MNSALVRVCKCRSSVIGKFLPKRCRRHQKKRKFRQKSPFPTTTHNLPSRQRQSSRANQSEARYKFEQRGL
eukprot:scaffold21815_cov157-Skeletonema_dohrnii-CCMP3373.AAC.1